MGARAFADGVAPPVGALWSAATGTVPVGTTRFCPWTAMTGEAGLDEMGAEGTTDEAGGGCPGVPFGVMTGYAAAPGVPCLRVFLNSVIADRFGSYT